MTLVKMARASCEKKLQKENDAFSGLQIYTLLRKTATQPRRLTNAQ